MATTKIKHKAIKDASKAIWFDKSDSMIMPTKWNIIQVSSQRKDQASVYKIEVSDKALKMKALSNASEWIM